MGRPDIGLESAEAEPLGEAESFLARHPDVEAVEFLITDPNGVPRGKWAPASAIAKSFVTGVNFPFSLLGLDIWGREVMETGLHVETGDRDGFCYAVPGSLRIVPWAARPTAQVILEVHTDQGVAFYGDPRVRLKAVIERLAAAGLTACIAHELEFYLLDPKAAPAGNGMLPPVFRSDAGPVPQNMYALSDLAEYSAFFSDVWRYGKAQGLPIDTMVSEAAPGQFEVNLKHRADALAATDDAVMLKRLITETARQHGLRATFMAKPFIDIAGNGLHIHASLIGPDGCNIFADAAEGERCLEAAIAGLLDTMQAATLVFVPTWNGFRRLQPGSYAPTTCSWAYNNRSVGVRVPASPPEGRRLEHRIAGADANPYLVTAAVLAGMLDGIERGARPPPPVERNAYEEPVPPLTADMGEAIRAFERAEFIRRTFGAEYRSLFAHLKRAELAAFRREITPLERMTYL